LCMRAATIGVLLDQLCERGQLSRDARGYRLAQAPSTPVGASCSG
jgi:hypothetical protein